MMLDFITKFDLLGVKLIDDRDQETDRQHQTDIQIALFLSLPLLMLIFFAKILVDNLT